MSSIDRRRLMDQFNLNDELCKLTEEFIFTFPYMEHESNYSNPATDEYARASLRCDTEYKLGVLKFKELFLTKTDALLHADLHTGSLMANTEETYVIDMEFAFFGPFGFDIGKIIANFLMSYTSHFFHSNDDAYQKWLLAEAMTIWKRFETRFLELWDSQDSSAMLVDGFLTGEELQEYKIRVMRNILNDCLGFCACSLARRTLGIAGVADIRDISDLHVRSQLEIMNLKLSRMLISMHDKIDTIEQFESTVRTFYTNTNFEFYGASEMTSSLLGIIPAAGSGVRARPYSYEMHKGLFSIDGQSNLSRLISIMRDQFEIEEIVIALGYMGDSIRNTFGDGKGVWCSNNICRKPAS